ncbi:MFS transporter [Shimia haliotis]|uniref:Predicted arabinose efflux permease, MFS family n=1 Tax=Shimia haliotis TaxID=1280847 RepID=A0A1I4BDN4_9RHOB|nr:MFS transporter [Shimia haliotis]SFK66106.1 Predicted arabinose efflux permease, MFS family [Shimia haliotis]
MVEFIRSAWALLLGMLLLMIGNGMHGTLLGIRGEAAGFSTLEMSMVMSAYFVGFLGGSRIAPDMIRRVGHVRVFAALASFISAILIMYPTAQHPIAWVMGRILIGFCFSGVYVTAESWLNNAASNENRGQALSLYMMVQMLGIVTAQGLVTLPDTSGFVLFVIPSVLVSISFAPILLSISPTPAFDTTKPMSLRELFGHSPLGVTGMFLMGGVFSAQFGMSAVYATRAGLSVSELSLFIATFYIGATICQYPLGWISDRMDRRVLIMIVSLIGALGALLGFFAGDTYTMLLASAFFIGGFSNPLYSLLIAHTNDFLEYEDMAAASGGLVFVNGVGAIAGPIIIGWSMDAIGPQGFFIFLAMLLTVLGVYAGYRTTRRAAVSVEDTGSYTAVMPTASPVVVEVAQEVAIETALEEEAEADDVAN